MATDNNSIYHGTDAKIISQVSLPDGNTYEIHDPKAIHDVSELGLSSALAFKGTKSTEADLPTTDNKLGDVWLVTDKNQEYVWVEDILRGGNTGGKEMLYEAGDFVYAYLATSKTYSAAQFVGATVKVQDLGKPGGEATYTIANNNVVEQISSGFTIKVADGVYIWCAIATNYKGLPSVGTYLSYQNGTDIISIKSVSVIGNRWEPLGSIHDAASSTHYHTLTSGTAAAQTWTQTSGTVAIPQVTAQNGFISASAVGTQTISSTDAIDVLTADTTFDVTGGTVTNKYISVERDTDVAVEGNGTASVITGFGTHTTDKAIKELNKTTINNPTVTPVTIPNVTVNTTVDVSKVTVSAAPTDNAVNATVVNGVLNLSAVTVVTSASKVTETPKQVSKVTLGTAISASSVETTPVDVATPTPKTRIDAITALGTANKETVLKGVKVKTQPTFKITDNTTSGDVAVASGIEGLQISPDFKTASVAKAGASVSAPTIKLTTSTTAPNGSNHTAVTTNVSVSSTTGTVTVTGRNSASDVTGTTGEPE